jgi:hypothetical protein
MSNSAMLVLRSPTLFVTSAAGLTHIRIGVNLQGILSCRLALVTLVSIHVARTASFLVLKLEGESGNRFWHGIVVMYTRRDSAV